MFYCLFLLVLSGRLYSVIVPMCGHIRPPDKSAYLKIIFFYFSTKTYVMGTQKNRLNETVLLSTKTHVKTDGQETNRNFMLKFLLNWTYDHMHFFHNADQLILRYTTNSFHYGVYFFTYWSLLLITFAISLIPDQVQRTVGPDLDSNCLIRLWFSKKYVFKI